MSLETTGQTLLQMYVGARIFLFGAETGLDDTFSTDLLVQSLSVSLFSLCMAAYKVRSNSQGMGVGALEYLKQQSTLHGFPVQYLEFGNEFFIRSHYQIFFADAEEYIARIRTGLTLARTLFPGAKLGVPAGYRFCSNSAVSC